MPIFGAKSRAERGCASKLACGRRIGPAERTVFTEVFGKFATFQRADVGIGPYNERGKYIRIRRKFPKTYCFPPGGAEPAPTSSVRTPVALCVNMTRSTLKLMTLA